MSEIILNRQHPFCRAHCQNRDRAIPMFFSFLIKYSCCFQKRQRNYLLWLALRQRRICIHLVSVWVNQSTTHTIYVPCLPLCKNTEEEWSEELQPARGRQRQAEKPLSNLTVMQKLPWPLEFQKLVLWGFLSAIQLRKVRPCTLAEPD